MNVRYPLMLSVFAAAVLGAACSSTEPLAGQGTKTQYDLQLDSVTPSAGISVKVGKTATFQVWVSQVGTGLQVTSTNTANGATPSNGTTGNPATAIVVPNGTGLASVKGVAVGATTLTGTWLNVNTGATLTAATTIPVTVTP